MANFLDAYNPPPTGYLQMGDAVIRVFNSFPLQFLPHHHRFHPEFLTHSLCYFHPLPYPFTWFVDGTHAVCNDLYVPPTPYYALNANRQYAEQSHVSESDDEVFILDDYYVDINDQVTNQSFETAGPSGLTKKFISNNLRVERSCEEEEEEEEGEICVICQSEFEKEKLAVLQCQHRYHPRCIKEWLLLQNVCPICKGEVFSV
ncbi:hypothetical protein LXL04_022926 [Taraxacum kok-saghyz]